MKRLLPLLVLLAIGWGFAGPPSASAQQKTLILTARNDTAFTFVNTSVDVDVQANDEETNPGFEKFIEKILRAPFHGTAFVDRNNTPQFFEDDFIRYTPNTGFFGADSLRYELRNDIGLRDSAVVFIFVNRAPVARRDTFHVARSGATQLDVLANDTDADPDSLTVEEIIWAPVHGTAVITNRPGARQVISYTPGSTFTVEDSLRYRVFDGRNGRDSAWVNIFPNTPPVANDDAALTQPGTAVDIAVLTNDTDPDGDALTVAAITTPPANGTAQIIGGQTVRYTPNAGFTGTDTFRYRADDGLGGTDDALVRVSVNAPPVANDDAVFAAFETALDIDVLANDTDADGDALSVQTLASPPSHGVAVIVNNNQAVRYTPDDGFFGEDRFDYTGSDGRGGTDRATVVVTVQAEALVQLIHNAPGAPAVDVYANDERVADDLAYRHATAYVTLPAGEVALDVTGADAPDNSAPVFSATVTLDPNEAYVAAAQGVVGENFGVLLKEDARTTADEASKVEFFIVHGVPDAPPIDVRVLDPLNSNEPSVILANNLVFGEATGYKVLDPGIYNIDATNFDNTTLFDAYGFDLGGLPGETFVLLASGLLADDTFTLLGFDAAGNPITPDVVTATAAGAELPAAFALHGNFPNPFNPTTTIRFDLPEAAEVRVEVIDLLGRRVMEVPARQVEAGANRSLRLDAARLASGTYLYRVVAAAASETMVGTGRMTLVK